MPHLVLIEGTSLHKGAYVLVRRLGRGRTSQSWIAKSTNHDDAHVCLKVYSSDPDDLRRAEHEIVVRSEITRLDVEGRRFSRLLDYFKVKGRKGARHIVLVTDWTGEPVSRLIDQHMPEGVRRPVVKYIARQILIGLHLLHTRKSIVLADMTPKDIHVTRTQVLRDFEPEAKKTPVPVTKLAPEELTASAIPGCIEAHVLSQLHDPNADDIFTKEERAVVMRRLEEDPDAVVRELKVPVPPILPSPEAEAHIFGDDPGDEMRLVADPTAMGTDDEKRATMYSQFAVKFSDFGHAEWAFHHYDQDDLISRRAYRSPEVILGLPFSFATDIWSAACVIFELFTGDTLFKPGKTRQFGRDPEHLALIAELGIGFDIPPHMITSSVSGTDLFKYDESAGRYQYVHHQPRAGTSLALLLRQKFQIPEADANEFATFLLPMLNPDPIQRVTAWEALMHPYLAAPIDCSSLRPFDLEWETRAFMDRELPEYLQKMRDADERRPNNKVQTKLANKIADGLRFDGRHRPIHRVGHGSFSDVYMGRDYVSGDIVAIKIEVKDFKGESLLLNEAKVYEQVGKYEGFPTFFWSGRSKKWSAMVMEFLGPYTAKTKFETRIALKLAYQLTLALRDLHSEGYLHNDLKPHNIVFRNKDSVCIVDLGLAKHWRDPETGEHIPWSTGRKMLGNPKFASINNHRGNALSRRDDLEAMAYVFHEYLRGETCWHGTPRDSKAKDRVHQFRPLMMVKRDTPVEVMFRGAPPEFAAFLAYARSLSFEQAPDYDSLAASFKRRLKESFDAEIEDVDYEFKWRLPDGVKTQLMHLDPNDLSPMPEDPDTSCSSEESYYTYTDEEEEESESEEEDGEEEGGDGDKKNDENNNDNNNDNNGKKMKE